MVMARAGLSRPEERAVTMLIEEIEKRTAIRLAVAQSWPATDDQPVIVVTARDNLTALALPDKIRALLPAPPDKAEAFVVRATKVQGRDAIFVVGRDARGMLFGIGHLLRQLHLRPGRIELPVAIDISTAPQMRGRGHQL